MAPKDSSKTGSSNKGKKVEPKVVVEYKISMYCKGCEKTIAQVISKFKGVQTFSTDMIKHRVIVKGRFHPEKLLKKLKRKTGKKVEMAVPNETVKPKEEDDNVKDPVPVLFEEWEDSSIFTMFSDENPNACSIM